MENIWIYEVKGQAKGIVIANSEYEAIETVVASYSKHGDKIYPVDVNVVKGIYDNGWKNDCPNVLEVIDLN